MYLQREAHDMWLEPVEGKNITEKKPCFAVQPA